VATSSVTCHPSAVALTFVAFSETALVVDGVNVPVTGIASVACCAHPSWRSDDDRALPVRATNESDPLGTLRSNRPGGGTMGS
jgi:hypothetical protein